MSAREIMANAILDAGRNMGALAHYSAKTFEGKITDFQLEALTAAGYRILAPGSLDDETLERAAQVAASYIEVCEGNGREFRRVDDAIRALKADRRALEEDGRG